jgi:hypothetical protein
MSTVMSPSAPISFPAGQWTIYMTGLPDQSTPSWPPPTSWQKVMTFNLYQFGDVANAPQYGGTAQLFNFAGISSFALENVSFNPGLGVVRFRITGLATLLGATEDPGSNFRFTFEGAYNPAATSNSASFTGGKAWVPSIYLSQLPTGGASGGGGEDDSNATWTGSQGGGGG